MNGRTLLGIWAHPDDEAYLSSGLMLTWLEAGGRVVVATATRGERGTAEPELWPPSRLAAHRSQELATSLAIIGVTEHVQLGFPDGGCADVDSELATGIIGDLIDDVDPDVVVSFGPEGMTGHPDHRAVSRWVTAACRSRPGRSLWYSTVTPHFHRRWGRVNQQIGLWSEQTLVPSTPRRKLVAQVRSRGRQLDRKLAALLAHRSQTDPLIATIGRRRYRRWWAIESFRRAPSTERLTKGSSSGREQVPDRTRQVPTFDIPGEAEPHVVTA